jgi:hypothetical protein
MGSGPVLSILVLTLVHFAAFGVLFWHLAGRELFSVFRTGSDDGRGGGADRPLPPDPAGDLDGAVPLPDASPSAVRLREPGRLAEGYPRRPRRPEHVPPAPQRQPSQN